MSKDVNALLEDVDNLSDEDKLYLQDRNIMDFGLKVTDVNPDAPDPANVSQPLGENTGDINTSTWDDANRSGDEDEAAADVSYEDMTKDDLADELERRGLPKSGNKDELIARLEEDDEDV